MVVPICLQWKQCLAGSLGVLLLILPTPICCLVSGSFAFPSDRLPFAITSRSFRVVISSPTPERTLTDQMIRCNSCAPTAARSARRRMNLVGKLWMWSRHLQCGFVVRLTITFKRKLLTLICWRPTHSPMSHPPVLILMCSLTICVADRPYSVLNVIPDIFFWLLCLIMMFSMKGNHVRHSWWSFTSCFSSIRLFFLFILFQCCQVMGCKRIVMPCQAHWVATL